MMYRASEHNYFSVSLYIVRIYLNTYNYSVVILRTIYYSIKTSGHHSARINILRSKPSYERLNGIRVFTIFQKYNWNFIYRYTCLPRVVSIKIILKLTILTICTIYHSCSNTRLSSNQFNMIITYHCNLPFRPYTTIPHTTLRLRRYVCHIII